MTPTEPLHVLHVLHATSPRGSSYVVGSMSATPLYGRTAAQQAAGELARRLPGWTVVPRLIHAPGEIDQDRH